MADSLNQEHRKSIKAERALHASEDDRQVDLNYLSQPENNMKTRTYTIAKPIGSTRTYTCPDCGQPTPFPFQGSPIIAVACKACQAKNTSTYRPTMPDNTMTPAAEAGLKQFRTGSARFEATVSQFINNRAAARRQRKQNHKGVN